MGYSFATVNSPNLQERHLNFLRRRNEQLAPLVDVATQNLQTMAQPRPPMFNPFSPDPQGAVAFGQAPQQAFGPQQQGFNATLPQLVSPQENLGGIAQGFAPPGGPFPPGQAQDIGAQRARDFAQQITPEQAPALRLLDSALQQFDATDDDYLRAIDFVKQGGGLNPPASVSRGVDALRAVAQSQGVTLEEAADPGRAERIAQNAPPEGFERTTRSFEQPGSLAAQQSEIDAQRRAQELGISTEEARGLTKEGVTRPPIREGFGPLIEGIEKPTRPIGQALAGAIRGQVETGGVPGQIGLERLLVPGDEAQTDLTQRIREGATPFEAAVQSGEEVPLAGDLLNPINFVAIPFLEAQVMTALGIAGAKVLSRPAVIKAIASARKIFDDTGNVLFRDAAETLTESARGAPLEPQAVTRPLHANVAPAPRPGERPLAQLAETERGIAAAQAAPSAAPRPKTGQPIDATGFRAYGDINDAGRYYTQNLELAQRYATKMAAEGAPERIGLRMSREQVSFQNPLVVRDKMRAAMRLSDKDEGLARRLEEIFQIDDIDDPLERISIDEIAEALSFDPQGQAAFESAIAASARRQGFDGIIFRGLDEMVVLRSSAVAPPPQAAVPEQAIAPAPASQGGAVTGEVLDAGAAARPNRLQQIDDEIAAIQANPQGGAQSRVGGEITSRNLSDAQRAQRRTLIEEQVALEAAPTRAVEPGGAGRGSLLRQETPEEKFARAKKEAAPPTVRRAAPTAEVLHTKPTAVFKRRSVNAANDLKKQMNDTRLTATQRQQAKNLFDKVCK